MNERMAKKQFSEGKTILFVEMFERDRFFIRDDHVFS